MKKQLLGLAACALILSSCSQNQEIENYEQMNREEVRLTPYVNKTKANVMGDVALQETGFKVFAVQHAAGVPIDYSGLPVFMNNIQESWNTDKWMHDGKYYWPETGALSFFMVAPYYSANLDMVQPTEVAGKMTLPITVNNNVADQIDILAASVLNQTKAKPVVDFTFKHILSKIGFAAKVKDGENLKFKITGISFTYGAGIVKDGTFTFGPEENVGTITTGATLHGAETSSVINIKTAEGTIIEKHDYVSINADNAYLMLMPQNVTGNLMTMTLNYQVAVAGDAYDTAGKIATIAIPAMEYKQGLAYTYNLILSSESDDDGNLLEVTFGTVDVAPWQDGTQPENVEVPKPTTPPAGS